MAVDEAAARACLDGASPPTLRLYPWRQPALTLGTFQPAEILDWDRCEKQGIPVVRRITGGGLVLHGNDLTYCVIAPAGSSVFSNDSIAGRYHTLSRVFLHGLRLLGLQPEVHTPSTSPGRPLCCFDTPSRFEVLIQGRKVVGSAQKKWRNGFLQQGSVSIDYHPNVLDGLLKTPENRSHAGGAGLNEFSSRPVTTGLLAEALLEGFREALGIKVFRGPLNESEMRCAIDLVRGKYGNEAWTRYRKNPERHIDNFQKEAKLY